MGGLRVKQETIDLVRKLTAEGKSIKEIALVADVSLAFVSMVRKDRVTDRPYLNQSGTKIQPPEPEAEEKPINSVFLQDNDLKRAIKIVDGMVSRGKRVIYLESSEYGCFKGIANALRELVRLRASSWPR